MITQHRKFLEGLGLSVLEGSTETELSQLATDYCGYFVSKSAARNIKKRILEQNVIIGENSSLKGETEMQQKLTPAQEQEIKRVCEANNLPYDKWNIDWAHIYDDESGKKIHTIQFVNTKLAEKQAEAQEEFLRRIEKRAPRYKTPRKRKVTDGHLHIIDVADLHINKISLDREGKVLYDTTTAVSYAERAVESLVTRGQGYNIEQFILPIGNDVLHTEGKSNATSSGTPQNVAGHWRTAIDEAFEMYVSMIEGLLTIAPVKVIHCRDNHAEMTSYMLAREVRAYLHRHKWFTSDISHLDRAYHKYGNCLLGFDHGHGVAGNKLPQVVAAEAASYWGETRRRVFYRHHVHHADFKRNNVQVKHEEILKDYPGLTVQYMRAPCPSDDWHHNAGYVGVPKAVDSFVVHPEMGQVAHLTCPV